MTYKWANAHEWLWAKADDKRRELAVLAPEAEGQVEYLIGIINCLLLDVDGDAIEDTFQEEMDRDGYFEEISATQ